MSDFVNVKAFGKDAAVQLLAAADALELPRTVVRVTGKGFVVPEEVAVKAGFVEEQKPTTAKTEKSKADSNDSPAPGRARAKKATSSKSKSKKEN